MNIKKFVRGTLGCQCPDDVFEKIEYGTVNDVFTNTTPIQKIVVGNRLLIVIWRVSDPALIENRFPDLIRWGKEERDNLGLNRTRIVIGTEDVDGIKARAERLFGAIGAKDERIHLHVVDISTLPDEIEMT